MFVTKVHSQGLPWPDGSTRGADQVFEFSLCLAPANGDRWMIGVEALREDRTLYLPASELQGQWLDAQADLMTPAGIELSWWLRAGWAAFELVERLGACRIGPSLQARYGAAGHDIIAPPPGAADAMLAAATTALEQGEHARAFDIASRLLVGEGYRARARRLRARVLEGFDCFDDARREREILALLGAPEPEVLQPDGELRGVAIELQGLPLDYPALDHPLVRYLYRLDVTEDPACWLVRLPEHAEPEQATWLSRTGAERVDGVWQVRGASAQDAFVMAVQHGLATTDRWGLLNRVRRAHS